MSQTDIPNSPIAGRDVPADTGLELRRARATIEVYYRATPGEFVDIQQAISAAMQMVGGEHVHRDLGDVLYAVDLAEHVVLGESKDVVSKIKLGKVYRAKY